jgi:ferredoxin
MFTMKVIVDRDTCIGCGMCQQVCAEIFLLDEEGLARAIVEVPGPDLYDCAREAAEICPVEAIELTGD